MNGRSTNRVTTSLNSPTMSSPALTTPPVPTGFDAAHCATPSPPCCRAHSAATSMRATEKLSSRSSSEPRPTSMSSRSCTRQPRCSRCAPSHRVIAVSVRPGSTDSPRECRTSCSPNVIRSPDRRPEWRLSFAIAWIAQTTPCVSPSQDSSTDAPPRSPGAQPIRKVSAPDQASPLVHAE